MCIFYFKRPLVLYPDFHEGIEFVQERWEERKYFFTNYKFIYARINQSIKFRHDYIFFIRKNMRHKQLILEEVADNLFGKVKENYFPR